jgi:hypothetical protein
MTMSDRKRAESYLAASGAVPISVTRRDGVCTIHAGRAGAHGDVLSTQWISEAQAIKDYAIANSRSYRDLTNKGTLV